MAEIFEVDHFHAVARLAVIQVADDVSALVEVNKMQIEFVAHGI